MPLADGLDVIEAGKALVELRDVLRGDIERVGELVVGDPPPGVLVELVGAVDGITITVSAKVVVPGLISVALVPPITMTGRFCLVLAATRASVDSSFRL